MQPPTDIEQRLLARSRECSSKELPVPLTRSRTRSPLPSAFSSASLTSSLESSAGVNNAGMAQLMGMITELQAGMRKLQEQLQDETRARYKQSLLLTRVVEDLLRMKGIQVSDEVLEEQLRVATNFLDELAVQYKVDYDDLEIGELIASGGFSDVYEGIYEGQKVAIKHLRVDALNPDSYFVELEEEVKLLSELDSPNVLQFRGVCIWPSNYIITEFMEGGTLDGVLHNPDLHLSWAVKLHILLQVANGLHYLHFCVPAVVHLDLNTFALARPPRSILSC